MKFEFPKKQIPLTSHALMRHSNLGTGSSQQIPKTKQSGVVVADAAVETEDHRHLVRQRPAADLEAAVVAVDVAW